MKKIKKLSLILIASIFITSAAGCDSIIEHENVDSPIVGEEEEKEGLYILTKKGTLYKFNTKNQNFEGTTSSASVSRMIWCCNEDKYIPTLYSDDKLVYYGSALPDGPFNVEEFIDLGYTIGASSLSKSTSGLISITDEQLLNGSNAYNILSPSLPSTGWQMAEINGKLIDDSMINDYGLIDGLEKGDKITIGVYSGTKYGKTEIVADTRVFCSYAVTATAGYTLTKNGYIEVDLGDLEDGYYSFEGCGLTQLKRSEKREEK